MNCPRCQTQLGVISFPELGDAKVHLCPSCEGAWYPESSLTALTDKVGRSEIQSSDLAPTLVGDKLDTVNLEAPVFCPECGERMSRFSYALAPKTQLDECLEHGMWLDDGELGVMLDQMLARTEGLAKERQQLEAMKEEMALDQIAKGAMNPFGMTLRLLNSLLSRKG